MRKKYPIKTKYGTFQAEIWFDKRDKVYYVTIPAFPGPMTHANTLVQAKKYASEVIELACLDALDDGKAIVDDTHQIYGATIRPGAVYLA